MHWNDHKKSRGTTAHYCAKSVNSYETDPETGEKRKVLARCKYHAGHAGTCSYRGIAWFPQPTNWLAVSIPWTGPWHGTLEDDVAFGRV